jgi:hypothetical protein
LVGFIDANWGNKDNGRKSYTGFIFILAKASITWELRKQRTIALFSTEAQQSACH